MACAAGDLVAGSLPARAGRRGRRHFHRACAVRAEALGRATELQRRADDGEDLPLLGLTFAVKDNIHVAGMATTSNCPGLLHHAGGDGALGSAP